ncbi:MAG: hypothetical protein JWN50_351 [Parcubacteria group bacterium]|nr:hypothetical protein [Parcubacteria group bacterium]
MDPEDRELLIRTAKLSEENNRLLRSVKSTLRWNQIWGFVKVLIIIVPFIIGYIFLQPYLGSIGSSGTSSIKDLLNAYNQ